MKKLMRCVTPVVVGMLIWGCGGNNTQNEDSAPPDPVVSVEVAPIVRETMPVKLVVDGNTEVLDRQTIVSPIDGTVLSLSTEVDAEVKAGDTLALIRTKDSEASISGARRLLAEAVTPRQRDDASKALKIAEESQQVVPIIAGRNGVVVDRMVSAGQTVLVNSDLLQLVDLSTLDFVANVPLQEIASVAVGQHCRINFPSLSGHEFAGNVAAVSARSDRGSQTAHVRITFDSATLHATSAIRVGMMGTASIRVGEHADVLAVPLAALLRDDINNAYSIYTVGPDSLARAVAVTVGVVNDSLAEVASPLLHAGQSVIIRGNYEVSDSTCVTAKTKGRQ